jgi:hypothetical protein
VSSSGTARSLTGSVDAARAVSEAGQHPRDAERDNQTQAGQLLGINRDQVRYRIEKFGLTTKS